MSKEQPMKYSDVCNVSGEVSSKPAVPSDAAAVRAAEIQSLAWNPRGSAAAPMESAAAENEKAGLVGFEKVSETFDSGNRVAEESIGGGQVVEPERARKFTGGVVIDSAPITIGEAMESAALNAPSKEVDQSDVAAIEEAELRATGITVVRPGDMASAARWAADINARTEHKEDRVTLHDLVANARSRMLADKVVTLEDAEAVMNAEMRNKTSTDTTPCGVGESIATAARINQANE